MIAAKRGKTESARTLLYHPDIDVNHRTKIDNTTALNEAAYRGLPDIVSLLIVRPEIDMNQVAYKGNLTPLIHATLGDNVEVVRLLLGHPETDVNQGGNLIALKILVPFLGPIFRLFCAVLEVGTQIFIHRYTVHPGCKVNS